MAQEQQHESTTPAEGQSRSSVQESDAGRAKLTGHPASRDFDFDAFADQSSDRGEAYEAEAQKFREERIAEEAANHGATLDPDPTPEPAAEQTEETSTKPDDSEQQPPRPSDRFKDEGDTRTGYDNLMTLQARQAEELGQLRTVAAQHHAEKAVRAEMAAQPGAPQPGQPARQTDKRHLAYERAVQFQKERYGLDDDEAKLAAQEMIGMIDYVASERVEQAAARVRPLVERFEGEKALQERVNRVALEQDTQGQFVRPDWQEITGSEEFQQVVKAEPDLINSDLGLRHAYQTAKYMQTSSPKAMAKEAEALKAEATKVVEQEKVRAAAASGGPNITPDPPAMVTEDQAAWDGMFDVDTDRHMLAGGSRRR